MDIYEIIITSYPTGKEDIESGLIQLQDDSDGQGTWVVSWGVDFPLPDGITLGKQQNII